MRPITRAPSGAASRDFRPRLADGGTAAIDAGAARAGLRFVPLGIAALVPLTLLGVASAVATAPRDIMPLQNRDRVSATGSDINEPVTVAAQHPEDRVVGRVNDVMAKDDPTTPRLDLVEVNDLLGGRARRPVSFEDRVARLVGVHGEVEWTPTVATSSATAT